MASERDALMGEDPGSPRGVQVRRLPRRPSFGEEESSREQ